MKQHITQKQWDEISNVQKDMIWNREEDGLAHNLKEPNIGQMIEFLGEKHTLTMIQDFNTGEIKYMNNVEWERDEELCDTLWEAVKKKLCN